MDEIKKGDWVIAHCDSETKYIGKYIGIWREGKTKDVRYELQDWRAIHKDGSFSYPPHNGGVFCGVEPIDIAEFLFDHINKKIDTTL
jgi:hypothetical protein